MKCEKCGKEYDEAFAFCPYCGKKKPVRKKTPKDKSRHPNFTWIANDERARQEFREKWETLKNGSADDCIAYLSDKHDRVPIYVIVFSYYDKWYTGGHDIYVVSRTEQSRTYQEGYTAAERILAKKTPKSEKYESWYALKRVYVKEKDPSEYEMTLDGTFKTYQECYDCAAQLCESFGISECLEEKNE